MREGRKGAKGMFGEAPAYLVAKDASSSTDKCRRMRGRGNGSCRVRTVKEEARTYKA